MRSKAFVIGTVLGPLLLGGVMLGPSLLMSKQRGQPLRVAVLDDTRRRWREPVERSLAARKAGDQARFVVAPAVGRRPAHPPPCANGCARASSTGSWT